MFCLFVRAIVLLVVQMVVESALCNCNVNQFCRQKAVCWPIDFKRCWWHSSFWWHTELWLVQLAQSSLIYIFLLLFGHVKRLHFEFLQTILSCLNVNVELSFTLKLKSFFFVIVSPDLQCFVVFGFFSHSMKNWPSFSHLLIVCDLVIIYWICSKVPCLFRVVLLLWWSRWPTHRRKRSRRKCNRWHPTCGCSSAVWERWVLSIWRWVNEASSCRIEAEVSWLVHQD